MSLANLQILPKIHYSFPFSTNWLQDQPEEAIETARIMGSVNIAGWGGWPTTPITKTDVENAVTLAVEAANRRGSPVDIAINYSPYHYVFRKSGDTEPREPVEEFGIKHVQEIALLTERFWSIRAWIAEATHGIPNPPKVSAILYDCEVFDITGDPINDAAVLEKYNIAYDKAKEIFPDARVVWYGFSGHVPGDWQHTAYARVKDFPLETKNEGASVSMYYPGEFEINQELFRKTHEYVTDHGINTVVPWVSLGSGYEPLAVTDKGTVPRKWTFDYDYPLVLTWKLGRAMNRPEFSGRSAYAYYDAADVIVFYPSPSDHNVPKMMEHFTAYVRGATNEEGVA